MLTAERKRRPKSFQFCNVWSTRPQFLNIVQSSWEVTVQGCKMFQVVKKMTLKSALRQLNTQNIINKAKEDRKNLKQAQMQLQDQPLNKAVQQVEGMQ